MSRQPNRPLYACGSLDPRLCVCGHLGGLHSSRGCDGLRCECKQMRAVAGTRP